MLSLAGIFGAAWLTSDRPGDGQAGSHAGGKKQDGSQRNRVVFQDRINTCGAAAFKMILERFGHAASLRDLERKLALSSRGTSLQRLKEIADEYELQACGYRLRREDLMRVQYPIIMFLKRNHLAVADSLDASGFLFVRDPAKGSIRISQQTLPDIWGGEALVFLGGERTGIGSKSTIGRD